MKISKDRIIDIVVLALFIGLILSALIYEEKGWPEKYDPLLDAPNFDY